MIDKYLYSFIKANKKDIVLKVLYFFLQKSTNYKVILYNTNETIINTNDDYLKHVLDVIANIKKDNLIYPCYLELLNNSTIIFTIDMEECIVEYFDNYNEEYVEYIISLIGKINNINCNCIILNNLISKLELILQNRINYLRAVSSWGDDKVLPYDESQITNLFNGDYKILFDLYPSDILLKINEFRNGNVSEEYFQDIIYQNIIIKASMDNNE